MTISKTCSFCAGHGKILCLNSWIIIDGYRWEPCGICGGDGKSDYALDAAAIRFQRKARGHVKEWGALRPPEDTARRLAPAMFWAAKP